MSMFRHMGIDFAEPKPGETITLPDGFDGDLYALSYGMRNSMPIYALLRHHSEPDGPGKGIQEVGALCLFPSENEAIRYSEHVRNPIGKGEPVFMTFDTACETARDKGLPAIARIFDADPKKKVIFWIN